MENQNLQNKLAEWWEIQKQLSELKAKESELRNVLFAAYFQNPAEGTNSFELAGGWMLKGKRVINRSVDKGSLTAMSDNLRAAGIDLDSVIEWQPKLKVSAYRKLDAEQTHLLDQVLVIKDGTPGLEIVLPKSTQKDS